MQKITITQKEVGKRIDKFLKETIFCDAKDSRGEVIRQIKKENILVNNKKIKPSYLLRENDVVEIVQEKTEQLKALVVGGDVKLEIIFQDENIIAINKFAGMQVHPDANQKENTLVNYLLADFPEIKNVHDDSEMGKARPGIVHRLDRDTSGVILVARNKRTFLELKRQFQEKEIVKKYWALVCGVPNPAEGVIEKPLARSADYRKQVIAGKKTRTKIREAVTKYQTLKIFQNKYALLELTPKTGRMHQIRVHLTSIGHPILGDKKYFLKNKKSFLGAKRQMLHARSIAFSLFGEQYFFETELPKDFSDLGFFLDEKQ